MRMTKEQRNEIETKYNELLVDSELNDCVFARNGGLTLRIYLEKPSNQRTELFLEFRGHIAGFSYDPLKEENITGYDEIISLLDNFAS